MQINDTSAVIISDIRRCGKSILLVQIMQNLTKSASLEAMTFFIHKEGIIVTMNNEDTLKEKGSIIKVYRLSVFKLNHLKLSLMSNIPVNKLII